MLLALALALAWWPRRRLSFSLRRASPFRAPTGRDATRRDSPTKIKISRRDGTGQRSDRAGRVPPPPGADYQRPARGRDGRWTLTFSERIATRIIVEQTIVQNRKETKCVSRCSTSASSRFDSIRANARTDKTSIGVN